MGATVHQEDHLASATHHQAEAAIQAAQAQVEQGLVEVPAEAVPEDQDHQVAALEEVVIDQVELGKGFFNISS